MATDDTLVTGPLSVNVDALWLVQALLGVERLAPELRTRPYGAARNDEWVGEHPGLQSLREAGVVDANGEVIPDLASRLAILNAPDVEVVILVAQSDWVIPPPGGRSPRTNCGWYSHAATASGSLQPGPVTTSQSTPLPPNRDWGSRHGWPVRPWG